MKDTTMGLIAWAALKTSLCDDVACRSVAARPHDGHTQPRPCARAARVPRKTLAGYCALIWAQPINADDSFIGTVVFDHDQFRFFAADVRLDELDGLAFATVVDLQRQIFAARVVIMNRITLARLE